MLKNKILSGMGGEPTDPYFKNVSLLLHGDGTNGAQNNTFIDSSVNNFAITRNGNVTQGSFSPFSKEPGKWGVSFDGSGDYLQAPANAAFAFGTGDFTIECWINAADSGYNTVFATATGSAGAWFGLYTSAGAPTIYTPNQGVMLSTIGTTNGTWNHIAYCRSGSTLRIFVNGVVGYAGTWTENLTHNDCYIGVSSFGSPTFNGTISNLRIVKGTALYTSNFTPPTTPLTAVSGTSLLCCQDNRFKDNSANNFTLTPYGDVKVTPFSPFANSAAYSASVNGGSGYFDGGGDYLTVPSNAAFAFGTGDFTIECWMNMASTSCRGLFKLDASSGYTTGIQLLPRPDISNTFQIFHGTGYYLTVNNSLTPLNTWCHVAIVRSGGTIQLFSNGVSIYSATDTTNYPNLPVIVGYGYASTYPMHGFIAGFRIVKGTALYTTNFTPPTTPLTAVTNTSLLLNFTNGAIFDNAMMNDIETVGNAQISTTVKKYGTGSISTPTSGYLINPDAKVNLGGGDFTIEFWVNSASDEGSFPGLVSVDALGGSDYGGLVITKAGVFVSYNGSSWAIFAASMGTVNDGTWRHIAVVRSGSNLYCFNNGILQSTTSITSAIFYKGPAVIVGKKADNFTTGASYIDDLRITKGYARYTANFTPPAQAFPDK